jgi:hypothetical protein
MDKAQQFEVPVTFGNLIQSSFGTRDRKDTGIKVAYFSNLTEIEKI